MGMADYYDFLKQRVIPKAYSVATCTRSSGCLLLVWDRFMIPPVRLWAPTPFFANTSATRKDVPPAMQTRSVFDLSFGRRALIPAGIFSVVISDRTSRAVAIFTLSLSQPKASATSLIPSSLGTNIAWVQRTSP